MRRVERELRRWVIATQCRLRRGQQAQARHLAHVFAHLPGGPALARLDPRELVRMSIEDGPPWGDGWRMVVLTNPSASVARTLYAVVDPTGKLYDGVSGEFVGSVFDRRTMDACRLWSVSGGRKASS